MNDFLYKDETYLIIGAAMEVHNELGPGFLEPVYQEAFEIELISQNIPYVREKIINIYYKNEKLKKEYSADFFCFDKIIVELKALNALNSDHESQLLNYLTATKTKVGLLINFGSKSLQHKRMVK
ncbi:MAG: GxxExxY protein [Bacteroidota bacterium]|nr:GxxExxY protein [Odoribacter sp.]MDP3641658.1 GxxExxY protein [Bacteroidota bacterium]